MRGLDLSEPLNLRDFEATREEYAFLIEAGITKYFIMRSDPNDPETDGDGLSDFSELHGNLGADGRTYRTRADRWDTDFDGANDRLELELGTDPLFPDANEFGIPDLPRFTLFQPFEPPPVVLGRWDFSGSEPRVHRIQPLARRLLGAELRLRDQLRGDPRPRGVASGRLLVLAALERLLVGRRSRPRHRARGRRRAADLRR